MKNRELDQLFKKRLTGYREKPSTQAWNRVEIQLAKKKSAPAKIILKVAAVVLLLAASMYILYDWNISHPEQNLAVNPQTNLLKPQIIQPETAPKVHKESPDEVPHAENIKPDSYELPTSEIQEVLPKLEAENEALADIDQSAISQPESPASETKLPEEEQLEAGPTSETQKPRIVITYKKAPSPPEPTLALMEESSSDQGGVKKIWLKAMDLRQGDFGLAHIRAAKDQLFAFNKILEKNKDEK